MDLELTFKNEQEFRTYVEHENKQLTYQSETQKEYIKEHGKEPNPYHKQLIMKKEFKDFDYLAIRNCAMNDATMPKDLPIELIHQYHKINPNSFWFCGYLVLKDFFNNHNQAKNWIRDNEQLIRDNILVYRGVSFVDTNISKVYGDKSCNLLIGFDTNHFETITSFEDFNKNLDYNITNKEEYMYTYKNLSFVLNELSKVNDQVRKMKNSFPEFKNNYVKTK
jgi:hypothetical protein